MNEIFRLAAVNAAATALTYQEHGFHVTISLIDGLPAVQTPASASELTRSLAQLTGTTAEALAMLQADAAAHRPQRCFSEYFTASSYASMQAPVSRQGFGRPAVIEKIKARTRTQYAAVEALADRIQDSLLAVPCSEKRSAVNA